MIKAVDFRGTNVVFAENQDEYLALPAMKLPDGETYTCWQLDEEALEDLKKNGGKIYVCMLTFNQPLMPLSLMTKLEDNIELT